MRVYCSSTFISAEAEYRPRALLPDWLAQQQRRVGESGAMFWNTPTQILSADSEADGVRSEPVDVPNGVVLGERIGDARPIFAVAPYHAIANDLADRLRRETGQLQVPAPQLSDAPPQTFETRSGLRCRITPGWQLEIETDAWIEEELVEALRGALAEFAVRRLGATPI